MELLSSLTILAIFFSIMILDFLWLGIITHRFIIKQFGNLIWVKEGRIKINLYVGLVAWFMIALGCYIFAVNPSTTFASAAMMGAVFGIIAYSIYDLTNWTFIRNYPVKFVFVDIAWGTFLCAAISTIGFTVKYFLIL